MIDTLSDGISYCENLRKGYCFFFHNTDNMIQSHGYDVDHEMTTYGTYVVKRNIVAIPGK